MSVDLIFNRNLTHERLYLLIEELGKANLSIDGVPFDIYSES